MSEQSRSLVVLRMLSLGFSPVSGLPLTPDDLKNDEIKKALIDGADALAAAAQPPPAPAKKGAKAPAKKRASRQPAAPQQTQNGGDGKGAGTTEQPQA